LKDSLIFIESLVLISSEISTTFFLFQQATIHTMVMMIAITIPAIAPAPIAAY